MILQDLIQEAYATQAVLRSIDEYIGELNQKRAEVSRQLGQLKHQMEQHEYAIGGWETTGVNGGATPSNFSPAPRNRNGRTGSGSTRLSKVSRSNSNPSNGYTNPWTQANGTVEWESAAPQRGRASSFRNVMIELMRDIGAPQTPMQISQALAEQMPDRDPERLRKHVIVALNKYNRYFRKVRHGLFELTPLAAAATPSPTGRVLVGA